MREKADRLKQLANAVNSDVHWTAQVGPQTLARDTAADETFYGGSAGGGKTDLLLGLASTQHWRSIIFRRVFPSMRSIIERSREIYHEQGSYNESLHIWRLVNGRIIELSSIQHEKDKTDYQGRPHDFYGWDEVTEFTESQFRFVNGWNRTARPGQRCRVIATGNPPTTPEGEWVVRYWGAWLDPNHPHPARPGELRWYVGIDGKDVEVENGEPFTHKDETLIPRSRTFIPARLDDNEYLRDTGYRSVLQSLPEPMRSQMLYGDFNLTVNDDIWQTIPTEWIDAAIERGKNNTRPDLVLRAVGVDPSRGGADDTVIAKLYGNWFDVIRHAGKNVLDGATGAHLVTNAMEANAPIAVDVISYGASVYDHLNELKGIDVTPVNVGVSSEAVDLSGRYTFFNLRSQLWWQFREALDPASGSNIALPNDSQLRTDLRAPKYQITSGKIKVESKEDVRKRIGRSTDAADAVQLAWFIGDAPSFDGRVHLEPEEGFTNAF